MCFARDQSGEFDPMFCPLLQGLTPEEQAERMKSDLRIKACVGALSGTVPLTSKLARQVDAYGELKRAASLQAGLGPLAGDVCTAVPLS